MSAVPPKAGMDQDGRDVRCHKRTFTAFLKPMSLIIKTLVGRQTVARVYPACAPYALANVSAAACLLAITANVDYGVSDNVGCDSD